MYVRNHTYKYAMTYGYLYQVKNAQWLGSRVAVAACTRCLYTFRIVALKARTVIISRLYLPDKSLPGGRPQTKMFPREAR